jgi:hypothetical protein
MMDSGSQDLLEKQDGTSTAVRAPTKSEVLRFIGSIIFSVLLVAGAVSYAIWHGNNTISANNQDWCTALKILTKTPVSYPADPKANPSRVFSYNLYESFRSIEIKFGCK